MHHLPQRGAPRQAWQSHDLMSSDTHAMDQLQDFLRQRREAREPVEDLDAFAQELPRLFVAAEREALGHALARFALDVPAIEVEGERYHRVLRCARPTTVRQVRCGSSGVCIDPRRGVTRSGHWNCAPD